MYELLRHLNDPEHPLTLEQLHVVSSAAVTVDDGAGTVDVAFTPTVPHCSMATLIGLCIRVKLLRGLPPRFKVTVRVAPGAHASEEAVNRQLADKERVAAALENDALLRGAVPAPMPAAPAVRAGGPPPPAARRLLPPPPPPPRAEVNKCTARTDRPPRDAAVDRLLVA